MADLGRVRSWSNDEGWGVIDSLATPGDGLERRHNR